MKFKPTPEQERIFKFIKKRPENILIEAYAGAGKSSTLVEAVNLLPPNANIMFLAFNKHIQQELKEKLPDYVRCYTSHGLGMSAIKRKYGDSIKFDEFKVDKHIKKKIKQWKIDEELNGENKHKYLQDLKKIVNLCRMSLTLDKKYIPYLADRHDIKLDEKRDVPRILKLLDSMTQDRKTFDYTDMIYLPAVDNSLWLFPQDYVLLDECLPHKTYISTTNGKKQIGTLSILHENGKELPEVLTYNESEKKYENKKILNVWCNGIKDVYNVILGGKRKLKSTVNHKFLTLNGWKRLDELKIGDAVLSNYSDQPYHFILNDNQKDIIIGSTLGDGNLNNISKNIFRLRIIHGVKQKEYIEWKCGFFDSRVKKIEENGYSNKNAYCFATKGFYFDDKFLSRKRVIDELNEKSLAISWMDDGSISSNYYSSKLYSTAYDYELTKYLSEIIEKKWGITSSVKNHKSSSTNIPYYWLYFNRVNTLKISQLVSPYIHTSMEYKVCPEHRKNINHDNWGSSFKHPYGCMVVTKEYKFLKKEKTYDMTVEDNHNFIVLLSSMMKARAENYGIITHNCQDINRAQQTLIMKMLRKDKISKKYKGRLISIGDSFQSIYGFTGITEKTFQWFKKFPNTKILPLSYSFRCSKKVIEKANEIVPEIKALPDAPEGSVRDGNVLEEAEDGDFVLCRTTMPLIKLFFEFLTKKKKAVIKGSDVGLQLIDLIGDHKEIPELINHWENEVEKFKTELIKSGILNPNEHSGFVAMEDKANTLIFLARVSDTIADLKHNIETIFTEKLEGIVLSTIHKAKGLEADRVFIIRPDKLPLPNSRSWQYIQEKNLEYVAITRSKLDLIYDREWTDE